MMIKKLFILLFLLFTFTRVAWGAEFIIMAKNNWMVDADKTNWSAEQITKADKQYRIGDIVQVFPDGKLSDYANAGGKFYVIRISGLSFESALKYQEQWDDENGMAIHRRKFRVRIGDLPASVKNKLKTTYVYNTTWTAVKTYIRNQITNLDE